MTTISIDDVFYVAALSSIAVTDTEAAALQQELDTILGYVQQLDELDTSNVQPTYQVIDTNNVMRSDKLIDYGVTHKELLKNALATQHGQLKVPKVL